MYLKPHTKQNMEDSKCQLLKKWILTAVSQVKAGNTSEKLLNQIRHIIYSLYREKEITKNV